MKFSCKSLCLILCCILMASSNVFAKDTWIKLKTKNFVIISNADERKTREIALKLEQFRAVFSQLFAVKSVSPVPVTVVAFKSDDSFKPFKPLYNGKPGNVAGYFQRGENENMIALDAYSNAQEHPLATIFHEYTHLLTSYTPRPWPVWLMEGIAEFYSSFGINKQDVTIGAPISNHVLLLRQSKFLPIQALISVGHDSPAYNERDKQGIFYAESWALVHYLMMGNKSERQPQLAQFVRLFNSGVPVEQAFVEAFKTDFTAMEKELRRYIGNDRYTGTIYTLNNIDSEKDFAIAPVSDAEVEFYLGDLLYHINRIDEAEARFKSAAALDPGLGKAHEGLGFVARRRNNFSEARKNFELAVSKDSANFLAHYYYAEALEREAHGDSRRADGSDRETMKKVIEEFKTSIRLMPSFSRAYGELGFALLVADQNLDEAAAVLKRAGDLDPQNKNYLVTLAHVLMRQEDYEGARRTLAPLLAPDADPQLKASAQSVMSSINSMMEYKKAREARAAEDKAAENSGVEAPSNDRPQLRRKDQESNTSGGSRTGPLLPKKELDIRLAGAETLSGILTDVECKGAHAVLVLKSSDKIYRFSVSEPSKLPFFTRVPGLEVQLRCGTMNLPSTIHYKKVEPGKPDIAGEAVAVEFTK